MSAQIREWQWEEKSVLNHIGPYTDTKAIFDAVCREVCRYYKGKDQIKTYKRKIKWTGAYLNCDLCFWSSHNNTRGEHVAFHVVATLYANDRADMDRKGILGDLCYQFRNYFNVYEINSEKFFEIVDYIDEILAYVEPLDSFDGFKKHMDKNAKHYQVLELESNGLIFLNRLKAAELH